MVLAGSAFFLPACSFTDDSLWPSLTGEDPSGTATQTADAQKAAASPQQAQQQTDALVANA